MSVIVDSVCIVCVPPRPCETTNSFSPMVVDSCFVWMGFGRYVLCRSERDTGMKRLKVCESVDGDTMTYLNKQYAQWRGRGQMRDVRGIEDWIYKDKD